jgi:putative hydrolase of the HAD superfamily
MQKRYYTEHGTTLRGLMLNHGIEPKAFLDEVHDVSMDPDPRPGHAGGASSACPAVG